MPSRRRVRLLALATIALATALPLVGMEIALRLAHRREMRGAPPFEQCWRASPHDELIYEYLPNRCGHNERGYRDRDHALAKPAGTFRIVVVGDSVAEGLGVDDLARTFPRRLEAILNARGPHPVEVITLARPGYTTTQELWLLEHEAFDYAPDLILWSYVLNDPADARHDASDELLLRYFRRRPSYLVTWLDKALYQLRELWLARACPAEYHARLHCAHWPEIERHLARIGGDARAHRVPVAFAIHPVLESNQRFPESSLAWVHDQLAAAARADGMTPIDLRAAFAPHTSDELRLPPLPNGRPDPWHPNPLGHELIATYLAQVLRERGLVP